MIHKFKNSAIWVALYSSRIILKKTTTPTRVLRRSNFLSNLISHSIFYFKWATAAVTIDESFPSLNSAINL